MTSQKEQFYIHRIAELEKQVAELIDKVAKLSKNSSNSSKPPRKKKNNGSHGQLSKLIQKASAAFGRA